MDEDTLKPYCKEIDDGSYLCEFYEKGARFGLSVETDGRVIWYWVTMEWMHSGYLPSDLLERIKERA